MNSFDSKQYPLNYPFCAVVITDPRIVFVFFQFNISPCLLPSLSHTYCVVMQCASFNSTRLPTKSKMISAWNMTVIIWSVTTVGSATITPLMTCLFAFVARVHYNLFVFFVVAIVVAISCNSLVIISYNSSSPAVFIYTTLASPDLLQGAHYYNNDSTRSCLYMLSCSRSKFMHFHRLLIQKKNKASKCNARTRNTSFFTYFIPVKRLFSHKRPCLPWPVAEKVEWFASVNYICAKKEMRSLDLWRRKQAQQQHNKWRL